MREGESEEKRGGRRGGEEGGGERRGGRGGSGQESFENFAGVISVLSDLPHSHLMVSSVATVCTCVSGVGFDREVKKLRMSLRSELVAAEA